MILTPIHIVHYLNYNLKSNMQYHCSDCRCNNGKGIGCAITNDQHWFLGDLNAV